MLVFAAYSHANKKAPVIPSKVVNVVIDGESFPCVRIYKVSGQTNYFSVREIAKIYNATLEWKQVSSQVTMHLNNRKINIKADNPGVVFGKKLKKMTLPSRLTGDDIYIPLEILKSKEFAEITEADTVWDPSSLLLSIKHHSNISNIRYFTEPESTQVLIQLEEPLLYTVSKTSRSVIIKILKGKVKRGFLSVNNGTVKDIFYEMEGQSALVKINLQQMPSLIETSMLLKPRRISVYIKNSSNIDMPSKGETVVPAPEEDDVVSSEKSEEAQISEIISMIENGENNKDLEKVLVAKVEDTNIIDENLAIISETEDVVLKQKKEEKEPCYKRKKIIALDAGHGGEDPGAVGSNGTREKDINFQIVCMLKTIFDNDGNYEIILTRKDDTFIPLAERTNIANECNADLFISVHCNASFDRSVNGFEIYFMSEKASDSGAVATAVLENSVLEMERKPSKKDTLLQSVFLSLAITEYINECSELCGFISAEATNRLEIQNKGVKQAGFYVLRGAQMPSVLVESAFISNYEQEMKFSSKNFCLAVANSIYNGVVNYYANKDKKQTNK
jgi:N-acetylmuramoyl-L-alanine amidase